MIEGFEKHIDKTLFRPEGAKDWAWYTELGMSLAIEFDAVQEYYVTMLDDERSNNHE